MRVEDVNFGELVEFDSEDGVVRFAGQRALIIDATAIGNLRKELVHHFGLTTARAILTRFGFVQGWRMAEAMQELFQWESEEDWHHACERTAVVEFDDLPEDPKAQELRCRSRNPPGGRRGRRLALGSVGRTGPALC